MKKSAQKGFTLIELLVVIAIISVLAVVVILTLNPAELIKQSRDSNRISDLNTMKSAISLYLADTASSTGLVGSSTTINLWTTCFISQDVQGTNASSGTNCSWFSATPAIVIIASTTSASRRNVDSSGWIPVPFTTISSGAPVGNLPIDPLGNNKNSFYSYRASTTASAFKLAGRLESAKYQNLGASDAASTDGGNSVIDYETGSTLTY